MNEMICKQKYFLTKQPKSVEDSKKPSAFHMKTEVGTQLFFTLFSIYRGNNTKYLLCFINSPQTSLTDLKRRLTQEVQSSTEVHLTNQHSYQNELG